VSAVFTGLCVGGPLAGQMIAQRTQRFAVEVQDPTAMCVTTITYFWHHTGQNVFWIPEGSSLHDAINTMAEAYVEKCNAMQDNAPLCPQRRHVVATAYAALSHRDPRTDKCIEFVKGRCAKRSISHFLDSATGKQVAYLERLLNV